MLLLNYDFMTRCYVCETELIGENISSEHIILNSIGGWLTSSELLCRKCNSDFGKNADAELSKQLEAIAALLVINPTLSSC
jgi:hypothetical protein